jgi:hypothetical protein
MIARGKTVALALAAALGPLPVRPRPIAGGARSSSASTSPYTVYEESRAAASRPAHRLPVQGGGAVAFNIHFTTAMR